MSELILASENKHKADEFREYFLQNGVDINIVTMSQAGFYGEIDETADSFEGNALIKAQTVAKATGKTAIADDSGLCVDYLNGAPGVLSARFAGAGHNDSDNNKKLLSLLENVCDSQRKASFVCVICACKPNGEHRFFKGRCDGIITREPRGDGNFGYDPLFFYEPLAKTFAQLTTAEKRAVSHRGRAITEMLLNKEFFF